MQLQSLWSGFTPQQYDYITNLIKNSDAKTVCELGTFVGTAAKNIWSEIKDTGKKLYLVDNYAFIPENQREKFFKTVKDSIDKDTKNIITVLQSSHDYDWTKHNFIFFGHHDADHMLPDLQIKRDVPIILNNINYEDSYSGDFTTRRAVIYTLSFTAKTYLYGPMSNSKVIKTAQADLGSDTDAPLTREERIVVVPKPTTADADDDFGFTTTISFFDDSKRYNPSTDTDT